MPQQLIYTSAPRGVVAGRSGHCTVARSATMREALMLQLEKLSYYQHLSLSGGQERPIYCCRLLDIRGSRYHVLTRIQDAGLDFTGRTNFLAHHLVFTPEEVRQFASPPVILRGWSGWVNSWTKEPELFNNENWSSLTELSGGVCIPAVHWQQVTGDAINGYGLLEARAGIAFRVDEMADEQVLALFAESLELLDLRDPRRDFRASAWQYTFTTSMQEQDNPADFRWRCLHLDNPAANRFAGPDCRALSEVRVSRTTNEEAIFARSGRQPPRFVLPPQNVSSVAGETARLCAKAEGVPTPASQWFTVDRAGMRQAIANATSEELVVQSPPLGVTRYTVRASNSEGETVSEVITLSVEQKGRAGSVRPPMESPNPVRPAGPPLIKSADDIERQRQRLEAENTQEKKPVRKWPFFIFGILFLVVIVGAIAFPRRPPEKPQSPATVQRHDSNAELSNLGHSPNTTFTDMPKEPPLAETHRNVESNTNKNLFAYLPPASKLAWPAEWLKKSIGAVPYAHADCVTNAPVRFNLSTAAEGVRLGGDSFFFVCQTNGNVEFQASLAGFQSDLPANRGGAAGIMLRASDSPTASLLFIGVWSGGILACLREPKGAFSSTNAILEKWPVILKFEQRDKQMIATYSFDHRTWKSFEGYGLPVRTQSLAGFAAWSGDSSNRVNARFVLVSSKEGSAKKN
jgi:hypothetical protein